MSKKKKESGLKHTDLPETAFAMPVGLPYGYASLVFHGGMLVAIPWEKDRRRLLASIRNAYPEARPAAAARLARCSDLLVRYAAGDFPSPDEVLRLPFDWERVSRFDRTILEATARIPAGGRATYGEVAARAGRPGCARAAGGALGRNPWPVLLPCHRVAGADGSLTGFGKGLPAKKALLEFESSAAAARRTAQ